MVRQAASGNVGLNAKEKLADWGEIRHFTPKQMEAMELAYKYRFLLYGGTRGPGKSYWLRWMMPTLLLGWHLQGIDHVMVMLACESYPVLRDRQISKIEVEFPGWLGKLSETKEYGLAYILDEEFGGGVIVLRNLDDPSKYVGAEFAAIGVDQLERIPLETFNLLRGSLRWAGIPRTMFLATGNPGGVGHGWNTAYFIKRELPAELQSLKDEFYFLRAYPRDNPYLDETYWNDLNTLPENLKRAWLEGDYEVFAGQAFPDFSVDKHVIEPFTIPSKWAVWGGVDWGYSKPFCHLWLTKDPDSGRVYVIRELYQERLTDRQQAKMIREMTPEENYMFAYADPAMWAKKTLGEWVSSTADEYAHSGVVLMRGDNDRLAGKRKIDRLLMALPDGKPGLQIFKTCKHLIQQMMYLQYDESKAEDVDTNQEDHAYDALRYGLTNTRVSGIGRSGDEDIEMKRRRVIPPLAEVFYGRQIFRHKVTRAGITQ